MQKSSDFHVRSVKPCFGLRKTPRACQNDFDLDATRCIAPYYAALSVDAAPGSDLIDSAAGQRISF